MWLGLYLAPKRHKLKQNRLDYQPAQLDQTREKAEIKQKWK